jgi:hypothetical protein
MEGWVGFLLILTTEGKLRLAVQEVLRPKEMELQKEGKT